MHARKYENFTPFLSHILYERNISFSHYGITRSEELIGNEQCANSAPVSSKSDVIWPIPRSLLIGCKHLEEAGDES
jgi:hypothetical protein